MAGQRKRGRRPPLGKSSGLEFSRTTLIFAGQAAGEEFASVRPEGARARSVATVARRKIRFVVIMAPLFIVSEASL
jgi:hypothetical protein